ASAPPTCSDRSDNEIIQKAMAAKNGAKFARLWNGDKSEYANNHSEADQGFCNLLVFWTGPDTARIDRIYRQSKLMRPKWDRDDYREGTIAKALEGRTEFYLWNGNGQGATPT